MSDPGAARAEELRRLHRAPGTLVIPNAWDAGSARAVVAAGARAVATASHSIAAAHGFPDGERIPLDLALAAIGRVVEAVEVPVSADLESGYGDAGLTARRAIAVGAVGCNLEDRMEPLAQAVRAVEDVVAAGAAEGVALVVNARTDAFLKAPAGADRAALVDEAVERGKAFAGAGADCVFVPGVRDPQTIAELVERLGDVPLAVLAGPGAPPISELDRLGVARATIGPWGYRVALDALRGAAEELLGGGALAADVPADIV